MHTSANVDITVLVDKKNKSVLSNESSFINEIEQRHHSTLEAAIEAESEEDEDAFIFEHPNLTERISQLQRETLQGSSSFRAQKKTPKATHSSFNHHKSQEYHLNQNPDVKSSFKGAFLKTVQNNEKLPSRWNSISDEEFSAEIDSHTVMLPSLLHHPLNEGAPPVPYNSSLTSPFSDRTAKNATDSTLRILVESPLKPSLRQLVSNNGENVSLKNLVSDYSSERKDKNSSTTNELNAALKGQRDLLRGANEDKGEGRRRDHMRGSLESQGVRQDSSILLLSHEKEKNKNVTMEMSKLRKALNQNLSSSNGTSSISSDSEVKTSVSERGQGDEVLSNDRASKVSSLQSEKRNVKEWEKEVFREAENRQHHAQRLSRNIFKSSDVNSEDSSRKNQDAIDSHHGSSRQELGDSGSRRGVALSELIEQSLEGGGNGDFHKKMDELRRLHREGKNAENQRRKQRELSPITRNKGREGQRNRSESNNGNSGLAMRYLNKRNESGSSSNNEKERRCYNSSKFSSVKDEDPRDRHSLLSSQEETRKYTQDEEQDYYEDEMESMTREQYKPFLSQGMGKDGSQRNNNRLSKSENITVLAGTYRPHHNKDNRVDDKRKSVRDKKEGDKAIIDSDHLVSAQKRSFLDYSPKINFTALMEGSVHIPSPPNKINESHFTINDSEEDAGPESASKTIKESKTAPYISSIDLNLRSPKSRNTKDPSVLSKANKLNEKSPSVKSLKAERYGEEARSSISRKDKTPLRNEKNFIEINRTNASREKRSLSLERTKAQKDRIPSTPSSINPASTSRKVTANDNLYLRCMEWQIRSMEKKSRQFEAQKLEAHSKCTFTPMITRKPNDMASRKLMDQTSIEDFYKRQIFFLNRKSARVDQLLRKKEEEERLEMLDKQYFFQHKRFMTPQRPATTHKTISVSGRKEGFARDLHLKLMSSDCWGDNNALSRSKESSARVNLPQQLRSGDPASVRQTVSNALSNDQLSITSGHDRQSNTQVHIENTHTESYNPLLASRRSSTPSIISSKQKDNLSIRRISQQVDAMLQLHSKQLESHKNAQ